MENMYQEHNHALLFLGGKMENKVALITGASRGLGKEIATIFAKNQINVIINYLYSKKEAIQLANTLEKKYLIKALALKCDISSEEEVKEMIQTIKQKFQRIDILINNAAISNDSIFLDKTKEDFLKIMETNLLGPFLVSKYASKIMEKGSIINISSTNALDTNYPYSADYDASKAGVISLSANLAEELAPNIRVNTVTPGWIKTDMTKDLDLEFMKQEEKKILLNRFADPKEIAEVVYFLTTDEASYINKSVIRVDGGYRG